MDLMDLYVKIGADTSGFDKSVKNTKESANSLKTVFNTLGEVVKSTKERASGLKSVFSALGEASKTLGLKTKTASENHKLFASELEKAKSKVKSLNEQYLNSVKQTGATSDATKDLRKELKEAEKDAKDLEEELAKYPSTMEKAKSSMSGFGNALKNAFVKTGGVAVSGISTLAKGVVAATAAAGTAVTALGAIGLNYNKQMESYTTNFEVMLGSQEAAAQKVEELKTMAAKTPFEMADLAKGTQTLLAFNVASEDTTGVLTRLGDISLGDSEKLDSLTRAYGKMNAAQKVTLEDINMMIDAGYNPLLNIQEKTGESMEDLYDRISAGEVSFSEIEEAIAAATSEGGQFYQGMEKASQTTEGLISTLKDNAQALVGEVFQPLSAGLTSTLLPNAIAAIDTLTNAFRTNGVNGMISAASEIIANALSAFTEQLPGFVDMAMQIVQSLVDGISQNLPTITDSAYVAFSAFMSGLIEMLPQLLGMALQIVTQLAQNIVNNLPQIIAAGKKLLSQLVQTLIDNLPQIVAAAVQIIATLAVELLNGIPDIVQAALELGAAVVQGIMDGIAALWNDLMGWFNSLWDSLFGNRTVNVSANTSGGSHAGGLDYVPYNGYMAQLHRGEAVLTRDEAESWRRGNTSARGGVTVIQNIYSQAKTAADLMREAQHEQERAVLLGV